MAFQPPRLEGARLAHKCTWIGTPQQHYRRGQRSSVAPTCQADSMPIVPHWMDKVYGRGVDRFPEDLSGSDTLSRCAQAVIRLAAGHWHVPVFVSGLFARVNDKRCPGWTSSECSGNIVCSYADCCALPCLHTCGRAWCLNAWQKKWAMQPCALAGHCGDCLQPCGMT